MGGFLFGCYVHNIYGGSSIHMIIYVSGLNGNWKLDSRDKAEVGDWFLRQAQLRGSQVHQLKLDHCMLASMYMLSKARGADGLM